MRVLALSVTLFAAGLSAAAALQMPDSLEGLDSAQLRSGWVEADGSRMIALDLQLSPGWKTYWRSPGEAGMVPVFDWDGSQNLASATPIWPAPEMFESAGLRTFGYHDRLVLPIRLTPQQKGQPIDVKLALDFGLCRDICVPAHLELGAETAEDEPDPAITEALALAPVKGDGPMECTADGTGDDGLRLTVRVAAAGVDHPAAAIEIAGAGADDKPPAWVSSANVDVAAGVLSARADVVPDSDDYTFDPSTVRLTVVGKKGATEFDGCAPDGPDQ